MKQLLGQTSIEAEWSDLLRNRQMLGLGSLASVAHGAPGTAFEWHLPQNLLRIRSLSHMKQPRSLGVSVDCALEGYGV